MPKPAHAGGGQSHAAAKNHGQTVREAVHAAQDARTEGGHPGIGQFIRDIASSNHHEDEDGSPSDGGPVVYDLTDSPESDLLTFVFGAGQDGVTGELGEEPSNDFEGPVEDGAEGELTITYQLHAGTEIVKGFDNDASDGVSDSLVFTSLDPEPVEGETAPEPIEITTQELLGRYDAETGIFTLDASGEDTLVIYDDMDDTTPAEAVLLIGATNVLADPTPAADIAA
ncbi:MAG: hypothetical protein VYD57_09675 [Pseudomonadota bacterium]|nr:hypothetical protein [Pseudomonadota bacterium]